MSASDDYDRHRLRTGTKYVKVSVKPFQRLAECEAAAPRKKLSALSFGLNGLRLIGRSACYMEVFILGAEVLIHEATF